MDEFVVEVPLNFKSGKSDKSESELVKAVKKLDKTMYMTLDWQEMLSTVLSDVFKLLQPLLKIISLMFMVIFLPLMPIIKELVSVFSELIQGLLKMFKGEISFSDFLKEYLLPAIKELFKVSGELIITLLKAGWEVLKGIGIVIWEEILKPAFEWLGDVGEKIWEEILKPAFDYLANIGVWIWETIIYPAFNFLANVGSWIWNEIVKPAFEFLTNVGSWIWEQILKPAFEWLSDIGTKIWNIIKSPFQWIANKIAKLTGDDTTTVHDAIVKPNGDIIQTSPKDYIFATKSPEKMFNKSSSNNITINNPVVRNEQDINKIADAVSKALGKKLWKSY